MQAALLAAAITWGRAAPAAAGTTSIPKPLRGSSAGVDPIVPPSRDPDLAPLGAPDAAVYPSFWSHDFTPSPNQAAQPSAEPSWRAAAMGFPPHMLASAWPVSHDASGPSVGVRAAMDLIERKVPRALALPSLQELNPKPPAPSEPAEEDIKSVPQATRRVGGILERARTLHPADGFDGSRDRLGRLEWAGEEKLSPYELRLFRNIIASVVEEVARADGEPGERAVPVAVQWTNLALVSKWAGTTRKIVMAAALEAAVADAARSAVIVDAVRRLHAQTLAQEPSQGTTADTSISDDFSRLVARVRAELADPNNRERASMIRARNALYEEILNDEFRYLPLQGILLPGLSQIPRIGRFMKLKGNAKQRYLYPSLPHDSWLNARHTQRRMTPALWARLRSSWPIAEDRKSRDIPPAGLTSVLGENPGALLVDAPQYLDGGEGWTKGVGRFAHRWGVASLREAIRRHLGPSPVSRPSDSGKRIYENPDTGLQVVADLANGYFRIFQPDEAGNDKDGTYYDLSGKVPTRRKKKKNSNIWIDDPISKDERKQFTHFVILE